MRRDNGLDHGGRFVDHAITPKRGREFGRPPASSWWIVPADQFKAAQQAQMVRWGLEQAGVRADRYPVATQARRKARGEAA